MEVKAKLRYLHIAPRKVRLVVDLVRGRDASQALAQLKFVHKRAAKPVAKLLQSAIANAEHNFNLEKNNLYIQEIRVDEGPKLKRWQPRAFGRAYSILKRSSHISIILAEKVPTAGKKKMEKLTLAASVPVARKSVPGRKLTLEETKPVPPAGKPAIWDSRREAKRRHKQHIEKKTLEGQKRLSKLRRIFRRKSV